MTAHEPPPGRSSVHLADTGRRQASAALVMAALHASGPASQAALARTTGLSRQTVHNCVRTLVASGDVRVDPGANGRETLVRLPTSTGVVIGMDIGYQSTRAMLIDVSNGRRTDAEDAPLSATASAAMDDVDAIVRQVDALLDRSGAKSTDLRGVGVSFPQPFDAGRQKLAPTPLMPGWAAQPIVAILSERLGVQIRGENDANAAALAELKWGAGRDCADFVYLMAAHGLGAGIISAGTLFRGGTGMAGEIGHVTLDDRGPICTCGKRGDLSSLASGRALVSQLRALSDADASLEQLIGAARQGDVLTSRLISDAGRYIGLALAHVVGVLAPSRIILGGPLAAAGSVLIEPIAAALRDMVIDPLGGHVDLVTSALGPDAALLGAVALVMDAEGIATDPRPAWAQGTTDAAD